MDQFKAKLTETVKYTKEHFAELQTITEEKIIKPCAAKFNTIKKISNNYLDKKGINSSINEFKSLAANQISNIKNKNFEDKNTIIFAFCSLVLFLIFSTIFLYMTIIFIKLLIGNKKIKKDNKIYENPLEAPYRIVFTGPKSGKTAFFYALRDNTEIKTIKTVKSCEINTGLLYDHTNVLLVDIPSDNRIMIEDKTQQFFTGIHKEIKSVVYVVFAAKEKIAVSQEDIKRLTTIATGIKNCNKKTQFTIFYVINDEIDEISEKPNAEKLIFDSVEELKYRLDDFKIVYKKDLLDEIKNLRFVH